MSARLPCFSLCGCSELPSGQSLTHQCGQVGGGVAPPGGGGGGGGGGGASWRELLVDESDVKSLMLALECA